MREQKPPTKFSSAFTLVELLLVIGIVVFLCALTLPAFTTVGDGSQLTQAGYTLNDQITLARQKAVTRNAVMELRFIRESPEEAAGAPPAYIAIQIWQVDPKSGNASAIERLVRFPPSVIVNPSLSPLLPAASLQQAEFGVMGVRSYQEIRFHANGRLGAPVSLKEACVTAQLRRGDREAPDNYYTLQINPLTGRIATYRP